MSCFQTVPLLRESLYEPLIGGAFNPLLSPSRRFLRRPARSARHSGQLVRNDDLRLFLPTRRRVSDCYLIRKKEKRNFSSSDGSDPLYAACVLSWAFLFWRGSLDEGTGGEWRGLGVCCCSGEYTPGGARRPPPGLAVVGFSTSFGVVIWCCSAALGVCLLRRSRPCPRRRLDRALRDGAFFFLLFLAVQRVSSCVPSLVLRRLQARVSVHIV